MQLTTVVLSAFGPQAITTAAVRRARELVGARGQVLVFPANRSGAVDLAAVRHLRHPSVQALPAVGRAGLRAALAQCGEGAVLLTHDDVTVGRRAARRLAEALAGAGAGAVAVPYLDEEGTAQQLDAPAPRDPAALPADRIPEVLATCLVGTAESLLPLADKLVHGPHTVLRAGDQPFVLAAGAAVSHARTCHQRVLPPTGPDGRPLLVASMIVRNEEERLADCLASLEGLVDRIEVCDTGSTDATVAIARSFGASVIERPWREDFALARNQVLERCTDAWYVLWIDADERIAAADVQGVRRRLATAVDDGAGFLVEVTSPSDVASEEVMRFLAPRIFSPRQCRFEGALHELPVAVGEEQVVWAALDGVGIEHLGYTEAVIDDRDKLARNLGIARAAYEREASATSALHYARALSAAAAEPWRAAALYEQVLANDRMLPAARATALAALARLRLADERFDEALALAESALQLVPADDDAAVVHADAALALGQPQPVLDMAEWRRAAPSAAPQFRRSMAEGEARSREVAAHAALGQFERAYVLALEVLERFPGAFQAWPELVGALVRVDVDAALELLLPAAVLDRSDGCVRALADHADPSRTARFALRVIEASRARQDTVLVGLTAAMVAQDWTVFEQLLPSSWALTPEMVDLLVERLLLHGLDAQAQRLLSGSGHLRPMPATPAPTPSSSLPPLAGSLTNY